MNLNEAANLLNLTIQATPEEVTKRLVELEQRFQEKIEAAPAGYLKEKHRTGLAEIRAAAELLRLSTDVYVSGAQEPNPGAPSASSPSRPPTAPSAQSSPPKFESPAPAASRAPHLASAPVIVQSSLAAPATRSLAKPASASRSKRPLVLATVLALLGGGLVFFLLFRSTDDSPLPVARENYADRKSSFELRWNRLNSELEAAQNLAVELEAIAASPVAEAPASTEARARARAQRQFTDGYRAALDARSARPLLERFAQLSMVKDSSAASATEAELSALLDKHEADLKTEKLRILTLTRELEVSSVPPNLAYLVIDAYGRTFEGRTPGKIDAPWGLTRVTVRAPGEPWSDWQSELTWSSEASNTVTAVFSRGPLLVASTPAGLPYELIRPDSDLPPLRGVTPANLANLPTGTALLRISRPGWPVQERRFEIKAEANTIALEFVGASLNVNSEPVGANVISATGESLGQTPLLLSDLPPGEQNLTLSLRGYETVTLRPVAPAGEATTTSFTLEPARKLETGKAHTVRDLALQLLPIPAGSFTMGSTRLDADYNTDESAFRVVLTREFWLGKTEVTRAQWRAVMGATGIGDPGPAVGDDVFPITRVSWDEATAFCRKLTARERAAGRLSTEFEFTLPTEAQWEFACRAGSVTPFHGPELDELGWYQLNSGGRLQPIAQKKSNALGLHDMHGNVWEWCADWFGFYPTGTVTDPSGPVNGTGRINRGGSWGSAASSCRSASRLNLSPKDRSSNVGFRVALVPVATR